MNNAKFQNRSLSVYNWIAVITGAVTGAVFGIVFGLFGNLFAWVIVGTLSGIVLGLANQVLLRKTLRLARWYRLYSSLLVAGETMLTISVPTLTRTGELPQGDITFGGYAFVDTNGNVDIDSSDLPLEGAKLTVVLEGSGGRGQSSSSANASGSRFVR